MVFGKMASENVKKWIERNADLVGRRILEIGSREYADHSNLRLREMFPEAEFFVGTDVEDGDGVDVVCDLRNQFETIDETLGRRRFDTIFCISVLEHIDDVFTASRNIARLLSDGGALFLSVPFVFRIHGYPSDYWRFTPEALTFLFPALDFEEQRSWFSTLKKGDHLRVPGDTKKRNRFMARPKETALKEQRKRLKAMFRLGHKVRMPEYSLAPTMVNMIGQLKRSPAERDAAVAAPATTAVQ